jgi:hypothetical protein
MNFTVMGFDGTIDGHNIMIHTDHTEEDMQNVVSYLLTEGFLDKQMWCQETGIF